MVPVAGRGGEAGVLPGRAFALMVGLVLGLGGCRACEGSATAPSEPPAEAGGPPMPVGLLGAGKPAAPPAASLSVPERLRLSTEPRPEWAELRILAPHPGPPPDPQLTRSLEAGPDSRFLSLDAMTLLHDAFGRASPGFDLFQPRRFDADAVGRLRVELALVRTDVVDAADRLRALARWGEVSAMVRELRDDPSWLEARRAWLAMIDLLTGWLDEVGRRRAELVVLGM
jgi:hypothetical protein